MKILASVSSLLALVGLYMVYAGSLSNTWGYLLFAYFLVVNLVGLFMGGKKDEASSPSMPSTPTTPTV